MKIGLSLSDLDEITLGMLLDIIKAFTGEDNNTVDEKYSRLKSIEKIVENGYNNGEISKEKYENYKKSLEEYEGAS